MFQEKPKPSHRCLCDYFGVSSPKQSAADASVFIVFLNGERPAMNRPHPLLIIINNASLPIYLPRTHTPLLLIAPAPPPTTPPPLHTSYTHGHTSMHIVYTHTHTLTTPHFLPFKYLLQVLISLPPPLSAINLTLFSLPHPLIPSLPATPQLHPFITILRWHSYRPPTPDSSPTLPQSDYSSEICIARSEKTRAEGNKW